MKLKSITGVSRHPKELTFAWRQGDGVFIPLWCAVILALGVSIALWALVRVVVPVSVAADAPRVNRVQLLVVDEESPPSLRSLLSDESLPSLGVEEAVADAPMLEGMLSLLGLQEENELSLQLYPEPPEVLSLEWPQEEKEALMLPSLSEVSKAVWPRHEEKDGLGWTVYFSGKGELGEVLNSKTLPWSESVPAIRHSVWSIVIDADGSLAFAAAVDSVDAEIKKMIRKELQGLFRTELTVGGPASGLVELTFERQVD